MLRYKNYVLLRGIFRIRKYKSFLRMSNFTVAVNGKRNKLAGAILHKHLSFSYLQH